MRRTLIVFTASCLAVGIAASASAQGLTTNGRNAGCALRIESASSNWVIRGFDPFSSNEPVATHDVMFVNEGSGECRFRPIFQLDQGPFGLRADTGKPIPYVLVNETDGYDSTPRAGRSTRRNNDPLVTIKGNSQELIRFTFNVDASSLPGDGLFTQNLMLEAESTDGAAFATRQLIVGIDVQPSAVMSLAGSFTRVNGQADIDLGELVEGVAKVPLQLNVRSTRAYRLGLESQNGGKLRLAGTEWSVPYQVIIDDRVARLGSTRGYVSEGKPGRRADALPIAFRIGDASQKRAGVYSDVLTVTIAVD